MKEYERILKEALEEIENQKSNLCTIDEIECFAKGLLSGLWIVLDYETFEKLEAEIRKKVEEKYDLFLGL